MQEIGNYLQQCREEMDLTIEKVAEKSRIKKYLLEDIEKNDFSRMGGYGFARVTIISYSRAIGADLDKTLALFEKNYRANREQRTSYTKHKAHRKLLLPGNILLILALALLVVVLSIVVWQLHSRGLLQFGFAEMISNGDSEPGETNDEPPADPVEAADEQPEAADEQPEAADEQPVAADEQPVAADEQPVAVAPVSRDTTDYVDRHVFLSEDNPLNVQVAPIPCPQAQ
ncbi:MAG: helix-turn-helix domain-containing protein [Candidatus Cloacimonetes bacterium]|nr:helix-turn-helix domain-containing protein [Candidatus Cloacimonadota bacterium]